MVLKNFFIVFLCFLVVSCQPSRPIPRDTIVIGIDKAPESFDPRLASDSNSQKINRLIYSGMLRLDDNLHAIPDLAKDFQIVDALTYVFHLRENVTFHNHKKLTSADVKATYESMQDSQLHSAFKSSLEVIDHIETPDEKTVVFKLKRPNSPFLTLMSLGILPKEYADKKNPLENQNLLFGAGPYKLGEHSQDHVLLLRFNDYFGEGAKTEYLNFRVVQDNTLRALELIKGRIDFIQNGIPYVLINTLKSKKNINFITDTGINFTYMAFNLKHEYLSHKLVRMAIAMAIDRDKIIRYKLSGMASPANSLLSPEHWAYNKDLPQHAYNLELAKKLLDQTPFRDPDGDGPLPRFTLVYKTSSVKERLEIAELIAENLAQIGIEVKVVSHEFGTFYQEIRQGDFDIFTLTWVGLSDPDIYYSVFHSEMIPPKGANRGYYSNKKLDALLDSSRREPNLEISTTLYQKIQKMVYDDFVYAPLWYENNYVFMNKSISGYQLRPDASYVNLVKAEKE